ncbi:hypothetical protein [Rhodococcus sp. 114MFTsu3.1]|nr:hypothetical protein [Rhodococcus sp. 114MFTsu3.1]
MNSDDTHAALAAVEPLDRTRLWEALKFLAYADPQLVLDAVERITQA